AGNLPGRRTAACWRGWGVVPGGAGSRGPPASAPAGRGALGMRADPSSSGRVAREHGTGWVHAAGGKSRLKSLYSENRILRNQMTGRVRLTDGECKTLAEIG